MIRTVLMSTVALVAISGAAFAADLPARRAPPVYVPPIPVFTWTGFYIGGQVGFAFGEDRLALSRAPIPGAPTRAVEHPNGIIGGAHMGYNWSTQGRGLGGFGAGGLVIGIEGDIDGTDYRDTTGAGAASTTLRNEIQGSARGRVGLAFDRALFYATGGAAFTQFHNSYTGPLGTVFPATSRIGYTVGGGVEYAVTTQWSLRAEYRYTDFGTLVDPLLPTLFASRREIQQRVQVGFSYKFDTPVAPVVARY